MTDMAERPDQSPVLIGSTSGLAPLPASLWRSWEVRQAVAHHAPGEIVAIARRAHGLRQGELGALAGFSQSAISRLEAGSNLAYDTRILRSLQRLLCIPASLLGLADDSVTLRASDVRRLPDAVAAVEAGWPVEPSAEPSVTLSGATLRAVCAALAFGRPVAPGDLPLGDPITPDIVGSLLVVRRIINDADNWRASAALKPVTGQLHELIDQLRRAATGGLRQRLLGLQALYAEFYGWLHEETADLREAVRWTTRALRLGQAAEDRDIVAYCYVRLSQLAEADEDPDEVIGLARAAERERAIAPRVRALALQQEARGRASAGDERAWQARIDDAVAALELAEPTVGEEYAVGGWFDATHLEVQRAAGLLRLGRVGEAITQYERVRPRWGDVCLWQQGVHTARLAVAHARRAEYDHAATLGRQALSMARRSDSALVTQELRHLHRWAQIPTLAELTDELRAAS